MKTIGGKLNVDPAESTVYLTRRWVRPQYYPRYNLARPTVLLPYTPAPWLSLDHLEPLVALRTSRTSVLHTAVSFSTPAYKLLLACNHRTSSLPCLAWHHVGHQSCNRCSSILHLSRQQFQYLLLRQWNWLGRCHKAHNLLHTAFHPPI